MATAVDSGTQMAVVTTEHTLTTQTLSRDYVLVVDLGAMATGDTVELRMYSVVLAAGTERVAYFTSFTGAQSQPIVYSVPVPSDVSWRVTLKQTAGTARSFPWKAMTV